jgi:hypothetical protein
VKKVTHLSTIAHVDRESGCARASALCALVLVFEDGTFSTSYLSIYSFEHGRRTAYPSDRASGWGTGASTSGCAA